MGSFSYLDKEISVMILETAVELAEGGNIESKLYELDKMLEI